MCALLHISFFSPVLSSACRQIAAKEEAAVKMPKTFQNSRQQAPQQSSRADWQTRALALAAYADTQNNCHYFEFYVTNEAAVSP